MQKSNIEWTDYTWNPIKGICPVGCWYCYARRMYQRFGWNPEIRLDGELFGSCQDAFAPNINVYKKLERIKAGSKIFICSTFELFHPHVPKEWKDAIFQAIKDNPQHTFQILTKLPQNIDREMPDNVWLGVTITGDDDQWSKAFNLYSKLPKIKFISFEPLFQPIEIIDELWVFDWIITGRVTGQGKKHQPERAWIQEIVDECKNSDTPVFLKNNLKQIWGEPLIQEFPNIAEESIYQQNINS